MVRMRCSKVLLELEKLWRCCARLSGGSDSNESSSSVKVLVRGPKSSMHPALTATWLKC